MKYFTTVWDLAGGELLEDDEEIDLLEISSDRKSEKSNLSSHSEITTQEAL